MKFQAVSSVRDWSTFRWRVCCFVFVLKQSEKVQRAGHGVTSQQTWSLSTVGCSLTHSVTFQLGPSVICLLSQQLSHPHVIYILWDLSRLIPALSVQKTLLPYCKNHHQHDAVYRNNSCFVQRTTHTHIHIHTHKRTQMFMYINIKNIA